MSATPDREIAVVVPSHNRALRLRWLLNALEEQTLARDRFEVVVAHDSSDGETDRLLETHPLALDGTLRHVKLPPAQRGSAGRLRNAAWRLARAPVIAFTDDDCFPPPDWLENALEASRRNPGAIVQGMTLAEPLEERAEKVAPWYHGQRIFPPVPFAQTCNIVYPRDVLERVDGFVEDPPLDAGEDTDLAQRAIKAGARYVGDRSVYTQHAIEALTLPKKMRTLWRWHQLPWLVKRHPELREVFPLWIFWKHNHVWLPGALAAMLLTRRNAAWSLLALPYVLHALPVHGTTPRGRIRELSELPGRMAIDLTEFAALTWGSAKYRCLFL